MHPTTAKQFEDNYNAVRERIDQAATKAGRAPEDVRLIAVSKTYPPEVVQTAVDAGITLLGENRPQELAEKATTLSGDITWAAIGHLQRNKARDVARYAHEFHALDSLRLAKALQQRLETLGEDDPALKDKVLDVFIQVNTSGEAQKGGFEPDQVAAFLPELAALPQLRLRGLMTMAAFSADETVVRPAFVALRELRDALQPELPDGMSCSELSMGMSGDFEWAVAEGATSVRVGTAIFGHRANSAYLK